MSEKAKLNAWVGEVADLCAPKRIHWCDGSDTEHRELLRRMVDSGTARRLDAATTRAIESLDADALEPESACGRAPARGLLVAARHHRLSVETVDLRNSGDTAGDRRRVVGYGAYVFC